MPKSVETTRRRTVESPPENAPEVSVCESSPGKMVFIESGNSDGWISTADTVELTR